MRFEVQVTLTGTSEIIVEAPDEQAARKLVEGLEAETGFLFPPEAVDDSLWDSAADISIDGVSAG